MLQITHTTLNNNNTRTQTSTQNHSDCESRMPTPVRQALGSSFPGTTQVKPARRVDTCNSIHLWHLYTLGATRVWAVFRYVFYIYFTGIHRILYLESSVTRGLTCKIFTYCLPRNMYRKLLLWMCCAIMGEWYDHCLFFGVSLFSQTERQKFFF